MIVSAAGIITSGLSTDYIKYLGFILFLSGLYNDAVIIENIELGELSCNEIGTAVTLF
jgi:hypothetical protein